MPFGGKERVFDKRSIDLCTSSIDFLTIRGLINADLYVANHGSGLFRRERAGNPFGEDPQDHWKIRSVISTVRKIWSCADVLVICFLKKYADFPGKTE